MIFITIFILSIFLFSPEVRAQNNETSTQIMQELKTGLKNLNTELDKHLIAANKASLEGGDMNWYNEQSNLKLEKIQRVKRIIESAEKQLKTAETEEEKLALSQKAKKLVGSAIIQSDIADKTMESLGGSSACGVFSFWKEACLAEFIGIILGVFVNIFAQVLNLAAWIFDQAIQQSIYNIGAYANMLAIKNAWTVIRDICNLFYLLILVYIALGTVLELEGINWKKSIGAVIISAILINFSMTIARVAIDITNVFSVYFYEMAKGSSDSLGASIQEGLSIAKLTVSTPENKASLLHVVVGSLGAIVVYVVASYTLLVGAALMLFRLVSLIFILVFSPLPFIGMAVPKFGSKITGKYWSQLVEQTTFAPVYMFCLYLVAQLLSCGIAANIQSSTDGTRGDVWVLIIYFFIVQSLLLGAIVAAKMAGASNVAEAEKIGRWGATALTGVAAGVAMGGTRLAGRGTYAAMDTVSGGRLSTATTAATGAASAVKNSALYQSAAKTASSIDKATGGNISNTVGNIKKTISNPLVSVSNVVETATGQRILNAPEKQAKKSQKELDREASEKRVAGADDKITNSQTTSADRIAEFKKLSVSEQANLDDNTLSHPDIIKLIDPKLLGKLAGKDLNRSTEDAISKEIVDRANAGDAAMDAYLRGPGKFAWDTSNLKAAINKITVNPSPSFGTYPLGAAFRIGDLNVMGYDSSGTAIPQTITMANVVGYDSSSPGVKNLTIKIGGVSSSTLSYTIV